MKTRKIGALGIAVLMSGLLILAFTRTRVGASIDYTRAAAVNRAWAYQPMVLRRSTVQPVQPDHSLAMLQVTSHGAMVNRILEPAELSIALGKPNVAEIFDVSSLRVTISTTTIDSVGPHNVAPANVIASTVVSGHITENATWTSADGPYRLTSNVIVDPGVTLTIEPGVTVMGPRNVELKVLGHLQAIGTPNRPIHFTSAIDTAASQWSGLVFDGGTGVLRHTIVRYGGDRNSVLPWETGNYRGANITIRDVLTGSVRIESSQVISETSDIWTGPEWRDAGLHIENSHVVVSDTLLAYNGNDRYDFGIYAAGPATVLTVTSSIFSHNPGYAIRVEAEQAHQMHLAGNTFHENGFDRILMHGEMVLDDIELCVQMGLESYQITNDLEVPPDVRLTFCPGVTLQAPRDVELRVKGHLHAVGTAAEPVLFTSVMNSREGQWSGLVFDGGTGLLRHATVRYGGNRNSVLPWETGNYRGANITVRNVLTGSVRIESSQVLTESSRPGWISAEYRDAGLHIEDSHVVVSDTLFAYNGTGIYDFGIYAAGPATVLTVTSSTFSHNPGYAIRVEAAQAHQMYLAGNTFYGNGYDKVLVQGGTLLGDTALYAQTGLESYRTNDDLEVPPDVRLTLNPGVTVQAPSNAELKVLGHLHAVGTAAEPILFTSVTNSGPGQWSGLVFDGGTGILRHATVRYGGNRNSVLPWETGNYRGANITVRNVLTGSVRIESSQVLTESSRPGWISAEYRDAGLHIENSHVVVSDTLLAYNGNDRYDFGIYAAGPATVLTVTKSEFRHNPGTAIRITPDPVTVDARIIVGTEGAAPSLLDAESCPAGIGDNRYLIRDSVFSRNGSIVSNYVIHAEGTAGTTIIDNQFNLNSGVPIRVPTANLPSIKGNVYTTNGANRLRLDGDATLCEDTVLRPDVGLEGYEIWGNLRVPQGIALTLEPGIPPLHWAGNTGLIVLGQLQALGADHQPLTLTSLTDTGPGQWSGVLFDSGVGRLRHTTLRYAQTGLTISEGEAEVRDSSITSNSLDGVRLTGATARIDIHDSAISGNMAFGIRNESDTIVDARDNWWGHHSGPFNANRNPFGQGDAVTDNVLFHPWLEHEAIDVICLVLDEPLTETLELDHERYYSVEINEPESALLVRVTPLDGIEVLDLMSRLGAVPLLQLYDQRTQRPNGSGVYELLLDPAFPGTHYFRALAKSLSLHSGQYQIEAQLVRHYLSDVQPRVTGNAGAVTLNIRGAGLDQARQVRLQSIGLPAIEGGELTIISSTELWMRFDLEGATVGNYDLIVAFSGGEELRLDKSFTVVSGTGGQLDARLIVPDAVRTDRRYTIWVEYENVGDADLPAPLLIVSTEPPLPIKTAERAGWLQGSIRLFGVNPREPAGTLPPGAGGRIPVVIEASTSEAIITHSLSSLQASDKPVDWDTYRILMRPETFTVEEWNALWPALQARLGETLADYLRALGKSASRLRQRGLDSIDVRQLLAFDILVASEQPAAAIVGQVLNNGRDPLPYDADVIARRQDGQVIRAGPMGVDGRFAVTHLSDGVYDMVVEGGIVTPTVTVTISDGLDVTGLTLWATPVPRESGPVPVSLPVVYDSPELLDVAGVPHLVFVRDGQIYHTTYDGAAWAIATAVPGAEGNSPKLLHAPTLLDGIAPGLALFWSAGFGNEAAIFYAVAQDDGQGGWAWSQPMLYAQGDVARDNPDAVVGDDGHLTLVWQMVDRDNLADDTDLYYSQALVSSSELSWDEIAGVLILDQQSELGDGNLLPAGTVVALTDAGEALVLSPGTEGWSQAIALKFELSKRGQVPHYIPYIGGQNSVEFTAQLSGWANEHGATASGTLGGSVSMLDDRVSGEVEGGLEAKWVLDKRECRFCLDEATLSTSLGATGEFPIPSMTWDIRFFKAEVGFQVGGTLSGDLIWRGQGGTWPDGAVSGQLGLGVYGTIEERVISSRAKGNITGTGNLTASVDASGFSVSDVYFEATGSIQAGPIVRSVKWRYPATSPTVSAHGFTLDGALRAALAEGLAYTVTVTLQDKDGTDAVYGDHAVLADVSIDRVDDGAPVLAHTGDGLIHLFWTRESEDTQETLGNTLAYAAYSGQGWTEPQALSGTLGFGRETNVDIDSVGNLLVVWIHSDATDWTLESDPNEVMDAYLNAEIRYAVFSQGDDWSAPAPLTAQSGGYRELSLKAQPNGDVWASWLGADNEQMMLYAARWDGVTWSEPSVVAVGAIRSPATALETDGKVQMIWAQDRDQEATGGDYETRLYLATFDGSRWTVPTELSLELLVPVSSLTRHAATASGDASLLLRISVPPELCDEDSEPDEDPDDDDEHDDEDEDDTEVVRPVDPNEKTGPSGVGFARWIDSRDSLYYTIFFENVITATTAAQEVFVYDVLDPALDWASLAVTEIAFGERVFPVVESEGGAYLLVTIPDYRSEVTSTWKVEVSIDLDYATGTLRGVFRTLDPETGELPEDPWAGFLPPNDETGRGEGRVAFSVRPRAGITPGTVIGNQAAIVFDTESSIWTNTWWNTTGTPYEVAVDTIGQGSVLRDPLKDLLFSGEVVTLTAIADPGWAFSGWSGDAWGTDNPLAYTVRDHTTITATFHQRVYLPVVIKGDGR